MQYLRKYMKCLFLILFLFFLAANAGATTTIDQYVDPVGGSDTTGLGTALLPWKSLYHAEAQNVDCVGTDTCYIIHCLAGADTTIVTVAGWNCNATRTLTIQATGTNRHTGLRATGYRIVVNTGYVSPIIVNNTYVILDGLAFCNSNANGYSGCNVTAAHVTLTNCFVYDCPYGGFIGSAAATSMTCADCIAVNCAGSQGGFYDYGTGAYYSNCTAFKCKYGFYKQDYTDVHCYNCYAGGSTTSDFNQSSTHNTLTLSYCMSSDNTATTVATGWSTSNCTASVAYSTANFKNVTAGSEDCHLVAGSALINSSGSNVLDAQTYWPTTCETGGSGIDFEGDLRGTYWDIGADEYVAPAATGAPASAYRRRMQ